MLIKQDAQTDKEIKFGRPSRYILHFFVSHWLFEIELLTAFLQQQQQQQQQQKQQQQPQPPLPSGPGAINPAPPVEPPSDANPPLPPEPPPEEKGSDVKVGHAKLFK